MGGENPSGNVWGDDTKKNGIIIKVTTWNGWKCFKSLKWAGIFPHLWFFFSSSSFFFSPIFPKWNKFHCLFLPSKKRKKSSVQLLFSFFFFDFELLEMIYVATPQHALKMDTKIFNQWNWNLVNIWNREIQWIWFFWAIIYVATPQHALKMDTNKNWMNEIEILLIFEIEKSNEFLKEMETIPKFLVHVATLEPPITYANIENSIFNSIPPAKLNRIWR